MDISIPSTISRQIILFSEFDKAGILPAEIKELIEKSIQEGLHASSFDEAGILPAEIKELIEKSIQEGLHDSEVKAQEVKSQDESVLIYPDKSRDSSSFLGNKG